MKVLIVDDEQISRNVLGKHLRDWGYEVLEAADGSEGLAICASKHPQIVLTDLFMPKMDGFELCRRIRELSSRRYVYIIILTGMAEPVNLFDGLFAGADDFLGKPLHPAELRARMRTGERVMNIEEELQERLGKLEEANQLMLLANAKMKEDLYAVAKIQSSLLPDTLPILPQVEFSWKYQPRCELAGDGLNVFRMDEKHVAFYVLDVSGSGTSAALLSVALSRALSPFPAQSQLLKSLIGEPPGYRLQSPAEILGKLNTLFPLDLETNHYFTIFFGVLNVQSRSIKYSVAGHPEPLVLRANSTVTKVPGRGVPIGFVDDTEYENLTFSFEPGDRLFVFSDGLLDVMDQENILFGNDRLSATLLEHKHEPLNAMLSNLIKSGEAWSRDGHMQDDVSILAMNFTKEVLE